MLALTQQDAAPLITLRPYQQTCVERVLDAYQRTPKGGRALLVLPTGGGKTLVFAEIARRLGLTTLIIAHRQELLQQAADKFRMIDPSAIIGQVGAGRHEWGAPITVASVQTISRPEHLKALARFGYDLVIVDEVHHACSESYRSVLDTLPHAFVLGVTATPDRLDRLRIEDLFGEPIFSASIIDLIEQGYLSNVRAIAIPTTTSLDDLHTHDGDFKLDELEVAVDTPERNERIVTAYLKHCNGRQALCFAVTVAHAQHLAETFTTLGVPASVVSGETPPEERKRVLHDYERGTVQVLCNCGVLLEGYDTPQTSCILMARPTKSRALYTQAIGRGTRLAPGKTDCIILDITDNSLKLRLSPLTLAKVVEIPLGDGESIIEARAREKQERLAGELVEARERTTRVTKRAQDLEINLLARFDWKRKPGGGYCLEVGANKHTIMLLPSESVTGYYSVWARLTPDFKMQQWLSDAPLEWAQMHAEMKARLIESSEKKLVLVDSNAPWRSFPVSNKQLFMLRKFGIPFTEAMTSGEASDLIGREIAKREKEKAEKAAQKGAKQGRKRGRASA